MVACTAWGCRNRSEKGVRMYGFPSDAERRKKWLAKLSRRKFIVDKNYNYKKICEAHFEADQFVINQKGKTRLRPDAVPTIFAHRPVFNRRKAPTPRGIQPLINIKAIGDDHSYSAKWKTAVCLKEKRRDEVTETREDDNLSQQIWSEQTEAQHTQSTEDDIDLNLTAETPRPLRSPLCLCGGCKPMPSAEESLCCREVDAYRALVDNVNPPSDITCLTLHPGFEACCLNPYSLQIAYMNFKQEYGSLLCSRHEQFRCTAYRQVVRWAYGILDGRVRKPIPSCVLSTIREAFPEGGHYKGFQWPDLGDGE